MTLGGVCVRVPAPWAGLARWTVQIEEREGRIGRPIEARPGRRRVWVKAEFALPPLQADATLALDVMVESKTITTITIPSLPTLEKCAAACDN